MFPVSARAQELLNQNVYQQARIIAHFKDNTTHTITNADIIQNGMSIDRYSVTGSSIELGTAIAAELNLKLNNHDGRFDLFSFSGAWLDVLIDIYEPASPSTLVQTIQMGIFYVDGSPRNTSVITITALDKITWLDKPVNRTSFNSFPTTIPDILIACASACGLTWASTTLSTINSRPNSDVSITTLPPTEGILTYRQLVMWCAGVLGANVYLDYNGYLNLDWYKCGYFDEEQEEPGYTCEPSTRYSSDLYENDLISITGFFYKASDYKEYLYGSGTYVLDLTGNNLVEYTWVDYGGGLSAAGPDLVLNNLLYPPYGSGSRFEYHSYSATIKPAPHLWPMDPVIWVRSERYIDSGGGVGDDTPAEIEPDDSPDVPTVYEDDCSDDQVCVDYPDDPDDPDDPTPILQNLYETITHMHYALNGVTTIGAVGETQEEHQVAPASSGTATIPDVSANNLGVAGNASFGGNVAVGAGKLLKVVSITLLSNKSISTNSYSDGSVTASAVQTAIGTGWTPLGVVGITAGGNNNVGCVATQFYCNLTNGAFVRVRNFSASASTLTMSFNVLCIRTSL